MKIKMLPKRFTIREMLNCWLRYVCAQPVDIDVNVIFILALQYIKLSRHTG